MAQLTSAQRNDVLALLGSEMSAIRQSIPITKPQFMALLNIIDVAAETDEAAIVSAIPAGVGKDWLLANPAVSRRIREAVAGKRKEVL